MPLGKEYQLFDILILYFNFRP